MKHNTWWLLSFFFALPAFAQMGTLDIFTNANQTRIPALDKDYEIALGLNGCAGVLIAPNMGMSASHCRMSGGLRSGMAVKVGAGNDARFGRTVEIGSVSTFDYWIFEITWAAGHAPVGMRVVPLIQTQVDQLKIGDNATADKIYTLGFPQDISHGKLIHSWGYAKSDGSDNIQTNNISEINGNSGGGLLRDSDDMAVSIVSGGPHAFGQPGWNNNDWNDSTHWNNGPALWKVYAQSKTLQDIFPGGVNRYKNVALDLIELEDLLLAPLHWLQ